MVRTFVCGTARALVCGAASAVGLVSGGEAVVVGVVGEWWTTLGRGDGAR